MKNLDFFTVCKKFACLLGLFSCFFCFGQSDEKKIQIGGGIGLNFGSGFTDVTLAPSAIYNFNQYFAAGVGIQGSYVRVKNYYESYLYGGSLIALLSPIEQIQLSAELEQLRVNTNFSGFEPDDNFWNTALYIGGGYRAQNVTVGIRYNVLYKENRSVYSEPFMPFVRIYF